MKKLVISGRKFINTSVFLILVLVSQYTKLLSNVNSTIEKIVSFMPIVIAGLFLFYAMTKKKQSYVVKEANRILYLYLPYFFLIICSLIFALLFNRFAIDIYGMRYWSRALDKLLLRVSFIVIVVYSWQLNKKNCLDSLKNALIIDGFLIILLAIIRNGLGTTMKACLASLGFFPENAATATLEVHEATLVIGLLLIYYLFFEKITNNKKTIFILSALFIIGGKRIAFLAFLVAIVVAFVLKRRYKYRTILLIALSITMVSFVFLVGIYYGYFYEIANHFGININNRDLIYGFFVRRTTLSPLYFGWGFSSVSRVIEHMDPLEVKWMVVVKGLHSDILKQYIEFGFWGFVCWLYYELVYLPNKLFKLYGKSSSLAYTILIIYAFITYWTDNTEGYFLFQSALFIIPLAAYESNKFIESKS